MYDPEERLLIAIGKIVASWAALEEEIKVQCTTLERFHPSGSFRQNVVLTNLETRFKSLSHFWQKLAKESYPKKEARINNINMALVDLSKDRNSVIHQTWGIAPEPHDIGTTTITQKDGMFHFQSFLTRWAFLEELPEKIDGIRKKIKNLQDL
ncbi:MAG: hypothetical protein V3R64_08305 [Sphingomonadales bacterium]